MKIPTRALLLAAGFILGLMLTARAQEQQPTAEPTMPISVVRRILVEKDSIANEYLLAFQQASTQIDQLKKDAAAKDEELKKLATQKCQQPEEPSRQQ